MLFKFIACPLYGSRSAFVAWDNRPHREGRFFNTIALLRQDHPGLKMALFARITCYFPSKSLGMNANQHIFSTTLTCRNKSGKVF
jgi:hypothetical protein